MRNKMQTVFYTLAGISIPLGLIFLVVAVLTCGNRPGNALVLFAFSILLLLSGAILSSVIAIGQRVSAIEQELKEIRSCCDKKG